MDSLGIEEGASKTGIDQSSYEVTDTLQDVPLVTAINVINAAGSAHLADSSQEAFRESVLSPETQLFVRLPFLFQSVAYQSRLDRAYSIYDGISRDYIPQEIRELDKTLKNLETIEKFLIARDKLIVWRGVANQSGVYEGRPELAEFNSLDDYLTKAAEFGDWLDQHPQAIGLRELIIRDACLSSIPPEIGKLTQLIRLDLEGNRIQRIEGLETLTQLQTLSFSRNQIEKLEGLEILTQLQTLDLNFNQIQRIEGLETLTQLEGLFLGHNQIEKLEGLESLTQLESLYLGYNQIQKLEGLETLTQLSYLHLDSNRIQRLEGLESLMQLEELHLAGNQIQKLEGMKNLTLLRYLGLCYNQIQKLEGLETLTQLRNLYLGSNQIQKIEGLENLMRLEELDLSCNRIRRIEGLTHLPHLFLISIRNPINSRPECNIQ